MLLLSNQRLIQYTNRVLSISIPCTLIITWCFLSGCARTESLEPVRTPFSVAENQLTSSNRDNNDDTRSILSVQLQTFDELIGALQEHYVHGDYHSVPWEELESRYRTKVLSLLRSNDFPKLIKDLISELPPEAAVWQSRDERIDLQSTDSRLYEGIGAYIAFRANPQPRVILLSVLPDSPAAEAGLKDHDSLLAVDGIPIRLEEGENVVTRIRGRAGSIVSLLVRSPNQGTREVTVRRRQVQLTEKANRLRYAILPNSNVGYLLLPRQTTSTIAEEMVQSLTILNQEIALGGLILDLRISALGNAWPLEELLTLFGNGYLGELYTANETLSIQVSGQDVANSQSIPLAILIGPDTEGRPEIFAAALQSIGRAVVFGTRTNGNIEDSRLVPLADGSRLLISSTSFRTANGVDVGLAGIQPSLAMSMDWGDVTDQNDPVRNASQAALLGVSR